MTSTTPPPSAKRDAVFVRGNFSRDHAALLAALEMSADALASAPRRPLEDVSLEALRGAAVAYWKGWTFVVHPTAALSLVPSKPDPELSPAARRLAALSDEVFALWTMPSGQASGFAALRRGGWARLRTYERGEVRLDAGRPLPFELRDEGGIDWEGWPRAASKSFLGVDASYLLDSPVLTATIHAPW